MPPRAAQVALAQMLMLLYTAFAAAPESAPQIDCVCTSTHFVDVSFAVKCWRNSTGKWSKPIYDDGSNTFTEESKVLCSRGPLPPRGADYRLVADVGAFKFHPRLATWEDALRTCAGEGANLAAVNSGAEAAAMAAIFKEFPKLNKDDRQIDRAWIGATDLKSEGVFLSLRGLTLQQEGWERWEKGEPDNEGDGEHCAALSRLQLLADAPCRAALPFFCERPA